MWLIHPDFFGTDCFRIFDQMYPKILLIFLSIIGFQLQAGTIISSASAIPNFGNCPVYYAAPPQKFTISGSSLSQNILIQAPEHFEISTTCVGGFTSNIALIPISGSVSNTTIYCRFSPYTSGTKTGNITCSSVGSTAINISLSGTATVTPATGTNASTYYAAISTTQTGASLKTALYNKILGHTITAYGSGSSGLWATYSTTDPFYNGKVWDIYSTGICGVSPYEFFFGTDQCGSYAVEGDCYNREHSFPQSWFASNSPMVSDMFHIYPTDGKVNGMRNNYAFGEVSSPTYTSLLGGKLGINTFGAYIGIVFEPVDEYKGDLARSYFYMATRYENIISGWQFNGNADDVLAGNAYPVYDSWFINLLIKWHNQDPPSVKEMNRNNAIFGYQLNRNPYIDSPQYVYKVWGGAKPLEPNVAASNFIVKNNTGSTALISWKSGNGDRRMVIARASALVSTLPTDSGYYVANNTFGSGTQLGSGNYLVYDGMGNTASVIGLNSSLTYYFTVIEYNGQGITANYLTSSILQSGGVVLPVTWLCFRGKFEADNLVNLNWSTAAETNNSRFEVMRSIDGTIFEMIGSVKGFGNSTKTRTYNFDEVLPDGLLRSHQTYFYKLKQCDLNGNHSFSKTIQIQSNNVLSQINAEPNPFETEFQLSCKSCYGDAKMVLTDLFGKTILEQQINLKDETTVYISNLFSPGMYFLHILRSTNQQTFKIIKR